METPKLQFGFMVGILSSLKLQKSTVKLQFGFIVSNISPLFHLASDNKGSKLPENCRY